MTTARLPFTVSAPASSGNLGPGFDVLAMALELRNLVKVAKGSGTVHVKGHGVGSLPTDATNLVARAYEIAAGTSITDAGIDLHCDNRIPPARGLGSSTAAAACGLVAGWEHTGTEWDEDTLFDALAELDGHPDNAAACAHGGIVLCRDEPDAGEGGIDVVALGAADWLTPIAVVPDRELSTAESRAALPTTYDRADVVRAISAASLLVGGLIGGHVELVEDALHGDVIHEPHRAALVPELAEVREATAHTDALGATLSGAGPTVLVWCTPDAVTQAHGSLSIDFPHAELLTLACAREGARVER
ncbi:MAG: homoserine kinase [Thermoleophilia bacterium]|nr:homoserine kinase [Thermoleophilia bacterium]